MKAIFVASFLLVLGAAVWWFVGGRAERVVATAGQVVREDAPTRPVAESLQRQETVAPIEDKVAVVEEEWPRVASPTRKLPALTGELAQLVIDFNNDVIAFERDAAAYRAGYPVYEEVLTLLRERCNGVRRQIAMAQYDLGKIRQKEGEEYVQARIAAEYDEMHVQAVGVAMAVTDLNDVMKRFKQEVVESGAVAFVDDDTGLRARYRERLENDLLFMDAIMSGAPPPPFIGRGEGLRIYQGALRMLQSGIPELSGIYADDDLAHKAFLAGLADPYGGMVDLMFNLASTLPENLRRRERELVRRCNDLANEREHRLLWYVVPSAASGSQRIEAYGRALEEEYERPREEVNLRIEGERAMENMGRLIEKVEIEGEKE